MERVPHRRYRVVNNARLERKIARLDSTHAGVPCRQAASPPNHLGRLPHRLGEGMHYACLLHIIGRHKNSRSSYRTQLMSLAA